MIYNCQIQIRQSIYHLITKSYSYRKILSKIPWAMHDDHVFLRRGESFRAIRTGLIKACENAGIVGHYGHHGGHSTCEMFDRYNVVDVDDAKGAVDQFEAFVENVDQTVDQVAKNQ